MGLLISLAHYGGCDLKSAGQAHSLYSRCLGYALPMVLSTNFPCSQWALIPNEAVSSVFGHPYKFVILNNCASDRVSGGRRRRAFRNRLIEIEREACSLEPAII